MVKKTFAIKESITEQRSPCSGCESFDSFECPQCAARNKSLLRRFMQTQVDCPHLSVNLVVDDDNNLPAEQSAPEPIDFGNRYSVREVRGHGGMSTVYRVEDRELGCELAFKLFHLEGESQNIERKVEKESKILLDLTHPNIGNAYGSGKTTDGKPYLILDWIEGRTLAEILQEEGRLSTNRALNIFAQLVEGIQHAHYKGVVHCDIKPGNIIISQNSDVEIAKIIDFGVAQILQDDRMHGCVDSFVDGELEQLTANASKQSPGQVCGTPMYMSPEQAKGNESDNRSDIYSLGCVLYEMLAGTPPFQADNAVKLILKHIGEQPKRLKLTPSGRRARDINNLLQQCLQKNPEQRYQTADELLQDVLAISEGKRPPFKCQTPEPSFWRRLSALIIDCTILSLPSVLLMSLMPGVAPDCNRSLTGILFPAINSISPLQAILGFIGNLGTSCTVVLWLLYITYFSGFECSPLQATPGKYLFALRVVDGNGRKLSWSKAVARCLAKTLWIGSGFSVLSLKQHQFGNVRRPGGLRLILQTLLHPPIEGNIGAYVVNRSFIHRQQTCYGTAFNLDDFTPDQIFRVSRELTLASLWVVFCSGIMLIPTFPPVYLATMLLFFSPEFVLCARVWRKRLAIVNSRKNSMKKARAATLKGIENV